MHPTGVEPATNPPPEGGALSIELRMHKDILHYYEILFKLQ